MKKDNIEECMTKIFEAMLVEEEKENNDIIKTVSKELHDNKINMNNPENFELFIGYKMERAMRELAKTFHEVPSKEVIDNGKIDFIYVNYGYLSRNIETLCILREGSCCCVDKSRHILKMYSRYALTGEIPEDDFEEDHYWIPNFGTNKQWIEFCDSLYRLYYGKAEQYFRIYNDLLKYDMRKYKHTTHSWFIKFKGGESIEFNKSWDDRIENPLDNEYFDKGDYYLIKSKLVESRNYEPYRSKDILLNKFYCKVPKEDIDSIYKTSEDVMV